MTSLDKAAAVVYVKDIARMSFFYANVLGFQVMHSQPDNIILESNSLQLILVAMPERIASGIHIDSPPVLREDTPIKLVLAVPGIDVARELAAQYGGGMNGAEREWTFQGARVCDGHDPEGNVVQFREIGR